MTVREAYEYARAHGTEHRTQAWALVPDVYRERLDIIAGEIRDGDTPKLGAVFTCEACQTGFVRAVRR